MAPSMCSSSYSSRGSTSTSCAASWVTRRDTSTRSAAAATGSCFRGSGERSLDRLHVGAAVVPGRGGEEATRQRPVLAGSDDIRSGNSHRRRASHPSCGRSCFVNDQTFAQIDGDTDSASSFGDPLPGDLDVRAVLDEEQLYLHAATVGVPLHWKVKSLLIGELSERSNVPAKTLRFYEGVGVLPEPPRTANGYRNYDDNALDRLAFIASAQAAGLTLAEISDVIVIRDEGDAPCVHVVALLDAKAAAITRQISELRRLQRELHRLRSRAADIDPADCAPATVCEVLQPQGR